MKRAMTFDDVYRLAGDPEVEWMIPEDSEFNFEVVQEDFNRFGPNEPSYQVLHFGNGFFINRRDGDAIDGVVWCESVEMYLWFNGIIVTKKPRNMQPVFDFPPVAVLGFGQHLSLLEAMHRFNQPYQGRMFPRSGSFCWRCGPAYFTDPPETTRVFSMEFGFKAGNPYLVGMPGFVAEYVNQMPYTGPTEFPITEIDSNDPVLVVGRVFEEAGLWKRPDRIKLGSGKKDFLNPEREGDQYWHVDGENLAEGEVEGMLTEMKKSLKKCGVKLTVKTTMWPHQRNSTGYRININGTDIVLYTNDADGNAVEDDPWMECTLRPLHAVNELLATAGSPYRIMVFEPGGPDTTVFLAPQDILQLIPTQPELADFTFTQP
jgi:hypothetical protein